MLKGHQDKPTLRESFYMALIWLGVGASCVVVFVVLRGCIWLWDNSAIAKFVFICAMCLGIVVTALTSSDKT